MIRRMRQNFALIYQPRQTSTLHFGGRQSPIISVGFCPENTLLKYNKKVILYQYKLKQRIGLNLTDEIRRNCLQIYQNLLLEKMPQPPRNMFFILWVAFLQPTTVLSIVFSTYTYTTPVASSRFTMASDASSIYYVDNNTVIHQLNNTGQAFDPIRDVDLLPYGVDVTQPIVLSSNNSFMAVSGTNTTSLVKVSDFGLVWNHDFGAPTAGCVPMADLKKFYIQDLTTFDVLIYQEISGSLVLTDTINTAGARIKTKSFADNCTSFALLSSTPAILVIRLDPVTKRWNIFQSITHPAMTAKSKLSTDDNLDIICFQEGSQIITFTFDPILQQYQLFQTIEPRIGVTIGKAFFQYLEGISMIVIMYDVGLSTEVQFQSIGASGFYETDTTIVINQVFTSFRKSADAWLYYDGPTTTFTLIYFCQQNCVQCDQRSSCEICQAGYVVERGKCRLIDNCLVYQKKYPAGSANPVCDIYCHRKCKTCSKTYDNCQECMSPYLKSPAGKCVLSSELSIGGYFYSVFFLIRSAELMKLKTVFFLVNDLQLYEFHHQDYTGIVSDIFITCREINKIIWRMLPLGRAEYWYQSPYQQIPNYNAYTNKKFLNLQRNDSIFWNNTKDFLFLLAPITLFGFFFCYGIFKVIFTRPISIIFRLYSFFWYLCEIILLTNCDKITFLMFRNFQALFSFNFASKSVQCLFIVFSGLFFLQIVCLHFIYRISYNKLHRYFLSNMFRKQGSFQLSIIRFVFKPFVIGIVHAVLYKSQFKQLTLLGAIQLFSFALMVAFQLRYRNFKISSMFLVEGLIDLTMVLFNFLLYSKVVFSQSGYDQTKTVIESSLRVVVYVLISLCGMIVLEGIWELACQIFRPYQPTDKVLKIPSNKLPKNNENEQDMAEMFPMKKQKKKKKSNKKDKVNNKQVESRKVAYQNDVQILDQKQVREMSLFKLPSKHSQPKKDRTTVLLSLKPKRPYTKEHSKFRFLREYAEQFLLGQ